ncbi:MAG: hypothetical protein HWN67_18785 [Candidatus Helarchaeota archaeon]|nr:hypothetical protein [Candidatus Helarchaeota archaeon]
MVIKEDVIVKIQSWKKEEAKSKKIKALIDSGAGGIYIDKELIDVKDPIYGGECSGEGMGGAKIKGKFISIQIEIPNKCHPFPFYACAIDFKLIPEDLKRKSIQIILGNAWLDVTGAETKGHKLIKCSGVSVLI